ncbi:large-conductance mechanosensitive channel [Kordia sp. SMS9]|uniref:large conductance mechanosensitive channel protein MscL n=1 Tax=Kordia sp. SMS9 TaxID=2282170 RepID=UPI000E0CF7EE|nr:large conductance mechanosensitive channel protein MscL [Kordia sp. SMS9]AXG68833.1 large-conductance mechanosensitive channel [Kordia sp. SMS9]
MIKEFREFITGGNVIEFAVAVIMAGAIGGVVKGFVSNIVMPVVGYFTGGQDFSEKKIILTEAVVDATGKVTTPENAIMWGSWVNTIVNLLIVGLVMFIIVKAYNKTKKKEEPAPEAPKGPSQEELLAEIRDLLKK